MTFFRLTWLQCSFLTFFHHYAALLCSHGLPLFYTTPHNLCLPPVLLWPPFWLRCPVLRPKAWSIAGRLQDSSCAWHMFTKKNSFICFISLLLALNFTPLLPTHPLFFSSGPPTTRSWTGDSPRGPVLNPSLTSCAAPSSSSLKALWNPAVIDNQRHLSQEPAAKTEMDDSKKGPN